MVDYAKGTVSSKHTRTDVHRNSERLWQHTEGQHRFRLDEVPVLTGGKWKQAPTPSQEAICNRYPLAEEKLVFSNGVSLSI